MGPDPGRGTPGPLLIMQGRLLDGGAWDPRDRPRDRPARPAGAPLSESVTAVSGHAAYVLGARFDEAVTAGIPRAAYDPAVTDGMVRRHGGDAAGTAGGIVESSHVAELAHAFGGLPGGEAAMPGACLARLRMSATPAARRGAADPGRGPRRALPGRSGNGVPRGDADDGRRLRGPGGGP